MRARHKAILGLLLLMVGIAVAAGLLRNEAGAFPSQSGYCDGCHSLDQSVTVSVTLAGETAGTVTYDVSGAPSGGWGVFNAAPTKVASGTGPGQFTLNKGTGSYRVYWAEGGSMTTAFTTITAPAPAATTSTAAPTTPSTAAPTTTSTAAPTTTSTAGPTTTTLPPTTTTSGPPPSTTTTVVDHPDGEPGPESESEDREEDSAEPEHEETDDGDDSDEADDDSYHDSDDDSESGDDSDKADDDSDAHEARARYRAASWLDAWSYYHFDAALWFATRYH